MRNRQDGSYTVYNLKFTAQIIWAIARPVVTIFLKYKGPKYLEILIPTVLTIYYSVFLSFKQLQPVTISFLNEDPHNFVLSTDEEVNLRLAQFVVFNRQMFTHFMLGTALSKIISLVYLRKVVPDYSSDTIITLLYCHSIVAVHNAIYSLTARMTF